MEFSNIVRLPRVSTFISIRFREQDDHNLICKANGVSHMEAVVLAGGYATRLWPITKNRPKMFLPVGDSTVIDRVFEELEADDRIDAVYVSTNARFATEFREHLEGSPFTKPTLSVEETTSEGEKLGVIGALAQLIERESIDDDLLVIAGDNLISFALADFIDFFESFDTPCLAAYDVGSIDRAQSYGVVELDGTRIVDFTEKPERPTSTLVSIACYAFPQHSLSALEEYLAGDNNPDEPGWFIDWLHERQQVNAFTFADAWFDIGTPTSYLDAIRWYLDGKNHIAEGATVERSTIQGNVHVMAGAEVVDSHLSDSVIFGDSRIEACELRECIIDEDTEIEGIDLQGALIGAHTQISNGQNDVS